MNIFNRYISTKQILRLFLALSFAGILSIFLIVQRMNSLLNSELGFNKDLILTIVTQECKEVLPDTLVFSSDIPGFTIERRVCVESELSSETKNLALQYISESYFHYFNYSILIDAQSILLNKNDFRMVYINESALKELEIEDISEAPGTVIEFNNSEFLVCGVVKDVKSVRFSCQDQPTIYQINSGHLKYAFVKKDDIKYVLGKKFDASILLSYQKRLENNFKIYEDALYSLFLLINIIIFLICLGYIGSKYASISEKRFFVVLGVGINALSFIISKTYLYMIVILGFVAGPLSILIHKFWLGVYENTVRFNTIDLFIFLSVTFLTIYIIFCPKKRINKILKNKHINEL